jgi:hypothetical protein
VEQEVAVTIDFAINCTGNKRMKDCVHILLDNATVL